MQFEGALRRFPLAAALALAPMPCLAEAPTGRAASAGRAAPRAPAPASAGKDLMKKAEVRLDEAASEDRLAGATADAKGKEDHHQAAARLRREALNLYDRAWREGNEPTALYLSAALLYLLKLPIASAEAAQRFLAVVDESDPEQKALTESAGQMLLRGLKSSDGAGSDPEQAQQCQQASLGFRKGILRIDDPIRDRFVLLRDGKPDGVWKSVCGVDPDDPSGAGAAGSGLLWSGVGVTVVAVLAGAIGAALLVRDSGKGVNDSDSLRVVDNVELGTGLLMGAGVSALAGVGLIIGGLAWQPAGAAPAPDTPQPATSLGIRGRF